MEELREIAEEYSKIGYILDCFEKGVAELTVDIPGEEEIPVRTIFSGADSTTPTFIRSLKVYKIELNHMLSNIIEKDLKSITKDPTPVIPKNDYRRSLREEDDGK